MELCSKLTFKQFCILRRIMLELRILNNVKGVH